MLYTTAVLHCYVSSNSFHDRSANVSSDLQMWGERNLSVTKWSCMPWAWLTGALLLCCETTLIALPLNSLQPTDFSEDTSRHFQHDLAGPGSGYRCSYATEKGNYAGRCWQSFLEGRYFSSERFKATCSMKEIIGFRGFSPKGLVFISYINSKEVAYHFLFFKSFFLHF